LEAQPEQLERVVRRIFFSEGVSAILMIKFAFDQAIKKIGLTQFSVGGGLAGWQTPESSPTT
jgi:hypothetical protein